MAPQRQTVQITQIPSATQIFVDLKNPFKSVLRIIKAGGKSHLRATFTIYNNKEMLQELTPIVLTPRVILTERAIDLIDRLRDEHGELMFHQSGGCCDGSAPMCFEKGEFRVGANDVWVGNIYGCDFFMSAFQFEYWQYTQLSIDVTEGRGASFSLEIPLGLRFIIRSKVFSEDELNHLTPVYDGESYPMV